MSEKRHNWTKSENILLRELYANIHTPLPLEAYFPGLRIQQIRQHAQYLGLSRPREEGVRVLLQETPLAYYWLGFIMADGTINSKFQLKISLALEDKAHLDKLADLLKTRVKVYTTYATGRQWCELTVMNRTVIPELMERFDIKPRKTYNPPMRLPDFPDFYTRLTYFAGIADGDGCIVRHHRRALLQIAMHANWRSYMINLLADISNAYGRSINYSEYVYPNGQNNNKTHILIIDHRFLALVRRSLSDLGIPLLERKWVKVDLQLNLEVFRLNKAAVISLHNQRMTPTEIAQELGYKQDSVRALLRRNGFGPVSQ